ncbi:MAG: transcriptional regulator PpsR [Gemmobacter sp.]
MLNGGAVPLVSPELLTEIVSSAADISLLISAGGEILSVLPNPALDTFGDLKRWEGRKIESVLTVESVGKLHARLESLRKAGSGAGLAVELTHADGQVPDFPVRYSMHLVPGDATLLLGRDLRPVAEMQQRLVQAQMALERDYEAQREMEARYRVVVETTRDAFVLVSMSSGRILDLNQAAAILLGGQKADLTGALIAQEFEGRRRGEFLESMANLAVGDASSPVELVARRSQKRLLVSPRVFRAAGERSMLCRLEDAASAAPVVDDLAESLGRLFLEGVDGIVFTDADGTVRAANDAFLNMIDAPSVAMVRGRSLADFLARGAVDLKVLLDNARRAGSLRLYTTRLVTDLSGQIAVEMAATWQNERNGGGLMLVIRDVSRAEALRRPGFGVSEDGGRSVMELVGTSTLREIVAETTDVVERMCIETAVELTRNNRVAAADMLGLSRQSLYVKLRKFGLLSRDEG